jgi:hypothetical protein
MPTRHILSAMIGLALTLPASSHGHELMQPNWCSLPNQEIQIISTFNFEKGVQIPQLSPPGTTHGVVDRYMAVSNNIALYCKKEVNNILGGLYDTRAIVTAPDNYLDADHHQFYDPMTEGLAGGCAICIEVPTPVPANPDPRRPHFSIDPEPHETP